MPDDTRAGVQVHWREMGSGALPVLALHCALAHGGAWAPVVDSLGARLRVIAPDMPGHGKSGDWDRTGDLHDQVTDMAATFLGAGCHLFGHSFGATVALRLALEQPGLVRSLVLIEPVLFAAARAGAPEVFAAHQAASALFRDAYERGDAMEAARLFTGRWGGGRGWDALSDKQRQGFADRIGFVLAGNRALNADSAGLLVPGRLEQVGVPVLLIRGAESAPIMAAIHDALAARLPDVRQVVVAGAGHMLPLSHAGEVAAEIGAFLDRVAA